MTDDAQELIQQGILGALASRREDLCDVLRQDTVLDRGIPVPRDPADPWPVKYRDVPVTVMVYQSQRVAGETGGAVTVQGGYTADFEKGFDIQNTDRIRVTSLNNRVFRMIAPNYASNEDERSMFCVEET